MHEAKEFSTSTAPKQQTTVLNWNTLSGTENTVNTNSTFYFNINVSQEVRKFRAILHDYSKVINDRCRYFVFVIHNFFLEIIWLSGTCSDNYAWSLSKLYLFVYHIFQITFQPYIGWAKKDVFIDFSSPFKIRWLDVLNILSMNFGKRNMNIPGYKLLAQNPTI